MWQKMYMLIYLLFTMSNIHEECKLYHRTKEHRKCWVPLLTMSWIIDKKAKPHIYLGISLNLEILFHIKILYTYLQNLEIIKYVISIYWAKSVIYNLCRTTDMHQPLHKLGAGACKQRIHRGEILFLLHAFRINFLIAG